MQLSCVLLSFLFWSFSWAQIQSEPVEIIEATPLDSFSERSGLYRHQQLHRDETKGENKTAQENLNEVAGIQARGNTGSPNISIRGSESAGRVLGLYDGIPLNFADGAGASNLLLPVENFAGVKIFKGPASVFYGANAMSGAINYIPEIYRRPVVGTHLGFYDQSLNDSGDLAQNGLFVAMPFLSGRENHHQISGFFDNSPGNYSFTSDSSRSSGKRQNNRREIQRYSYRGQQKIDDLQLTQNLIFAQENGSTPGSLTNPQRQDFANWAALGSFSLAKPINHNIEASYRFAGLFAEKRNDPKTPQSTNHSRQENQKFYNSFAVTHINEKNWQTRTFLDWSREMYKTRGSFLNGRWHDDDIEAGATFTLPFWQHYFFEPGFRFLFSHDELPISVAFSRLQGRNKNWVSYSEGFRTPTLLDRFSRDTTYMANPDLQPEKSQQYEIGYEHNPILSPRVDKTGPRFGAHAFYIRYFDFIDSKSAGGGVSTKVNRGSARSYGGEGQLGYRGTFWSTDLAYTYTDAKQNHTNLPLVFIPVHQVTVSAAVQVGPLVSEIENIYWSKYYDFDFNNNNQRIGLGPWNVVNINFRSSGFNRWQFRFGILNLFDEPRELTLSYPEPQRKYYVSVRHIF